MNRHTTLLACLLFAIPAYSQSPAIDPDAQVVHLRKDCSLASAGSFLDNCFTTTAALTTWIWTSGRTNPPSSTDRVHVEMGPGDFGHFECTGVVNSQNPPGWVSVHGSGREASRFVRTDGEQGFLGSCSGAIEIKHCDGLSFDNLGAYGPTGMDWAGAGKGNWNQVDIISEVTAENACPFPSGALAWYDIPDGASEASEHYIFSSRIWTLGEALFGGIAFDSASAESWVYGSDIAAFAPASGSAGAGYTGVLLGGGAKSHLFGGTVRVVAKAGGASNTTTLSGVDIYNGVFHMHGGIISVDGSQSPSSSLDVIGLRTRGGLGVAHTPDTAFNVKSNGTGDLKRLVRFSGSTVDSPFSWPASDVPPSPDSLHGQDAFVDTDAGALGGEAHLMIRDDTCVGAGGPWRDMSSGLCR